MSGGNKAGGGKCEGVLREAQIEVIANAHDKAVEYLPACPTAGLEKPNLPSSIGITQAKGAVKELRERRSAAGDLSGKGHVPQGGSLGGATGRPKRRKGDGSSVQ